MNNNVIRFLRTQLKKMKRMDFFRINCSIKNYGDTFKVSKYISGGGNEIVVGTNSVVDGIHIRIVGHNNRIVIGNDCFLGKGCSIWCEGSNIEIVVGDKCTFTHDTQLCAQENNSIIKIGVDCMFSHHCNVRTSDSHVIYAVGDGNRLNPPGNVIIEDHVWVAPEAKILKGVTVGEGSIIGTSAIVTKSIPAYSLAVGMPAKVVKQNVSWNRDKLF